MLRSELSSIVLTLAASFARDRSHIRDQCGASSAGRGRGQVEGEVQSDESQCLELAKGSLEGDRRYMRDNTEHGRDSSGAGTFSSGVDLEMCKISKIEVPDGY